MLRNEAVIRKMTLLEKTALLSGKTVWKTMDYPQYGISSIFLSDGPHGIRKQAGAGDHLGLNASLPATCFPPAGTMANSWDDKLGEEVGEALGEEAAALGVNIVLGPGLNIKRSPLCGRNFEYFSEDPYLSGKMAAAYIRGIQKKGVYACPKHFAVNNQELRRMAMNAVLDERTLRELYLTGFEIAVKEGNAKAIMSSYNQVNGTYANENHHLLQEILRDEWKFQGIVVSDWGGSNDHVKGVRNGANLEMPAPGLGSARSLRRAMKKGEISEAEIDQRVDELLTAIFELTGAEEKDSEKNSGKQEISADTKKRHHELAQKAAEASIVLLKNEEKILPLASGKKIVLIGDFAFEPRYQGAGSSAVNPTRLDNMIDYADQAGLNIVGWARGYHRMGKTDEKLEKEALALARQADIVLYCFGLDEISESEGLDRVHMRIRENQTELLRKIAEITPNVVGILSAGSAVEMPWDHCCRAILHTYLSGQAGAKAVWNILTGKVNPSGKLAESYPLRYEDTPASRYYPSEERNSEYREALFVGYRYYASANIPVRYEFGYGLSYTKFVYSDLQLNADGVTFKIKNVGTMDGSETAQLYVSKKETEIYRPYLELKGYKKVFVKAGETQTVRILFDEYTFRTWNRERKKWEIEDGNWDILIGASSCDIRLSGKMSVEGTHQDIYDAARMRNYFLANIKNIEGEEFAELLGTAIPDGTWRGSLTKNDALCQMYYAKNYVARGICKILRILKEQSEQKGEPNLNILFQYNMPFRALAKMTGGWISDAMVDGLVRIVNLKVISGFGLLVGGFFVNAAENLVDTIRLKIGEKKR